MTYAEVAALYEHNAPYIRNWLKSHTTVEIAEDLMQDVFVRLLKAAPSYEDRGLDPMSLVWTITRNIAYDWTRSKKNGPTVNIDVLPEAVLPNSLDYEVEATGPRLDIVAAVAKLSPLQARALRLRAEQGLSGEEIAATLHISADSTKHILGRGRTSLAKALGPEFNTSRKFGGRTVNHPRAA